MPVLFSDFGILLQRVEDVETRDPPYLAAEKRQHIERIISSWFKSHRRSISDLDAAATSALLSCLLPERRTDRVYCIQPPRLCRILGRSLHLSAARTRELESYTKPGNGDLACSLHRIIQSGGCHAKPAVTIDEVDTVLHQFASLCRFSDPSVKAAAHTSAQASLHLENILKRCSAGEGKWLVRLILKDFAPVRLDEAMVLRSYHFLLPDLLRFQNSFCAAASLVTSTKLRDIPQNPDHRSRQLWYKEVAPYISPSVGIKVGRPEFTKGRSIKHCMGIVDKGKWVLERKYDGEYCEIHIDRLASDDPLQCIKIFSKSGKDSTADRHSLHQTLVECLQLDKADCKIKRQAILLGEMVAVSDKEKEPCVLPFDQIRKHVYRSGRRIGADQDSPRKSHEHLAIVFFDLLLWDDEMVLNKSVDERRCWLRAIYRKIKGRAFSAEWKTIDFAHKDAERRLVAQYSAAIARRCEGLILKPCDIPYFVMGGGCPFIKLKKDYVQSLGDDADFAVIGASYDAQKAMIRGIPDLKWTDFHLGCLLNSEDVLRFGARPNFKYVGTIRDKACIPAAVLKSLHDFGQFRAKSYKRPWAEQTFEVTDLANIEMEVVFDEPLVVEVLGSGYEKPSNCNFLMLRHPRMTKHHMDRSWRDAETFHDLQERGKTSRDVPAELEETKRWIDKLTYKSKRKFEGEKTGTPSSKAGSTRDCQTPSTSSIAPGSHTSSTGASKPRQSVSKGPCQFESPCSSMPLGGTTLLAVSTPRPKRKRDIVPHSPCPAEKKQRKDHHSSPRSYSSRQSILADITNQQRPDYLPTPAPSAEHEKQKSSALTHLSTPWPPRPTFCTDFCSCLFYNTTIYLSAKIRKERPHVLAALLAHYNAITLRDMKHWDRDSYAHPPLGDTVSESQSHPGMRKIILVDLHSPEDAKATLSRMYKLNNGQFRERIDVYDLDILHHARAHDTSGSDGVTKNQFWVGAAIYDSARHETMFVYASKRMEGILF